MRCGELWSEKVLHHVGYPETPSALSVRIYPYGSRLPVPTRILAIFPKSVPDPLEPGNRVFWPGVVRFENAVPLQFCPRWVRGRHG